MNKIKKGDRVIILAGKDKGGLGEVKKVEMNLSGKPERVVVEGINNVTHYVRPNPQKNEPGGIIKKEASLHVSNVAVAHPETGEPTRVKIIKGEKGKERQFYSSQKRKSE